VIAPSGWIPAVEDPAFYRWFAPIMVVQTIGTVSPEQSFMACAVETAT
jgi:hypothetical protein